MEQEYGRAVIDELRAKRFETVKYTRADYDEIAERYKQKYEDLLADYYAKLTKSNH